MMILRVSGFDFPKTQQVGKKAGLSCCIYQQILVFLYTPPSYVVGSEADFPGTIWCWFFKSWFASLSKSGCFMTTKLSSSFVEFHTIANTRGMHHQGLVAVHCCSCSCWTITMRLSAGLNLLRKKGSTPSVPGRMGFFQVSHPVIKHGNGIVLLETLIYRGLSIAMFDYQRLFHKRFGLWLQRKI